MHIWIMERGPGEDQEYESEEEDELELEKLRKRLFESKWRAGNLMQMGPTKVYSEEGGFTILVGSCDHAQDLLLLETQGVSYVLNMAAGSDEARMNQEVYGDSVRYKGVKAGDMPGYNLMKHNAEVAAFLDEARGKAATVLVHCVAGASRSPTAVMAYLMQRHNWTLEEVAKVFQKHGKVAFPNVGFMAQLVQLDKTLHKKS